MRYWIWWNELVQGPFELEELVSLRAFSDDLLVCMEDREDWLPAGRVADLSSAIEQSKSRRVQPLIAPPPPPKRPPTITPLQGEFFGDPPGQQTLLESEDDLKGPFAYKAMPNGSDPGAPSIVSHVTMPFHFSRSPNPASVLDIPRPKTQVRSFERPPVVKESPVRELVRSPEVELPERAPVVPLKLLQEDALPEIQEVPETPARERLPSLRSPYDEPIGSERRLEWLPWIMGIVLAIGAMGSVGYWLMDRATTHSAIAEANRLESPKPLSISGAAPAPAPEPPRQVFPAPILQPAPAVSGPAPAAANSVHSSAPAAMPASGSTAQTPVTPQESGALSSASSPSPSSLSPLKRLKTIISAIKNAVGLASSPVGAKIGAAAAVPSAAAGILPGSSMAAGAAASAVPSQAASHSVSAPSHRTKVAKRQAAQTGHSQKKLPKLGEGRKTSRGHSKKSAAGEPALPAPGVKSESSFSTPMGSDVPGVISRQTPSSAVSPHSAVHPTGNELASEQSEKRAPKSASVSESASATAPSHPDIPVATVRALATVPAATGVPLPAIAGAAPGAEIPVVDAPTPHASHPSDPWSGRQNDAIKLVVGKTIPGEKITIGTQAKTLLLQMHEKELLHAVDTGERLYLPDKMAWTALQEEKSRYRVYLNFMAWQASGERIQARSYQFIVDLKDKTVKPDDIATEQDLLSRSAVSSFKHTPITTDIDSILGGVDDYNRHKVQLMIVKKSRSNRDERKKIETRLAAAQAKVRRAIIYFRRTYPEKALQNVAKAYEFLGLVNGQ